MQMPQYDEDAVAHRYWEIVGLPASEGQVRNLNLGWRQGLCSQFLPHQQEIVREMASGTAEQRRGPVLFCPG